MPDRGRSDPLIVDVLPCAREDAAIIRVQGEVDLANGHVLERRLERLVSEGVTSVVLDLTEVPFCDVPALNLFLRLHGRLRARGGGLAVAGACPPLRIMVSTLGLDGHLPLMPPEPADGAALRGDQI
jgi:anti-anti-sigma factor